MPAKKNKNKNKKTKKQKRPNLLAHDKWAIISVHVGATDAAQYKYVDTDHDLRTIKWMLT